MRQLLLIIAFTTTYLINISSQNIGIGTTNPKEKLHITEPDSTRTRVKVSGGGASPDGVIIEHVKGSDQINLFSTKGLFQLGVGAEAGSLLPRIRISPNKGVGIGGVFNPTHTLHLKGSDQLRLEGLSEKAIASDTILVVDGDGVVKYALKSDIIPSGSGYWSQNSTDDVYYLDSVAIGHNDPTSILDIFRPSEDVEVNIASNKDNSQLRFQSKLAQLEIGQNSSAATGNFLSGIPRKNKSYIYAPTPFLGPQGQAMIIANEAAVPIIFGTQDQEKMRIDSFGHVGIGVTSPVEKLEVDGTILTTDKVVIDDTDVGIKRIGGSLDLYSNNSNVRLNPGMNKDVQIFGSSSSLYWSVFDGDQRRLGINYLTPDRTLHVGGSGMFEDSILFKDEKVSISREGNNLDLTSFANMYLRPNTNGDVFVYSGSTRWSTFEGGDKRLGLNELLPTKTLDVGGSGLIQDTLFLGDDSEQLHSFTGGMKIKTDKSLNVNVGSTDVVTFNGSIPFARLDAGSESMSIGTTVQDKTLHVNGSTMIQDSIFIDDEMTSIHKSTDDLKVNAEADLILNTGSNGSVSIRENDSEWATFDGDNGRLGIGIGTPERTLHVEGSSIVSDTSFIGGDHTYITKLSSNIIVESENANVELRAGGSSKRVAIFADNTQYATFNGASQRLGIHTATPAKTLDVQGSSLVKDTMYIRDTDNFIGYNNASNSLAIKADDDIELRPNGNQVDIFNGGGRWAYFDGNIEQLNLSNTLGNPALFVNGKSEMTALQVSGGAIPGYVMMSDAVGNAIWSPVPSGSDWTIFGGGSHMVSAVPGNVSIGGVVGPVPPSKLSVEGSISLPLKTINSSLYPYTPSFNEHTIVCLDPGAVINLPAASAAPNRIYIIKFHSSGGTLDRLVASDKIDGIAGAVPVPPAGVISSVTVQSDGIDTWYIVQGNF